MTDFGPGARALVTQLVREKLIAVRRAEIVGRELAGYAMSLGRAPSAEELETWLDEHAQVTEMIASEAALAAALDEHLPRPKPPATSVRSPELEREILKARDEHAAAAVAIYADWLSDHGDPFGEQLQLALASEAAGDDRFQRWVRTNKQRVFGDDVRGIEPLAFNWQHGFVHTIHDTSGAGLDYRPVEPARWASLLGMRSCSLVRRLCFTRPIDHDIDEAIAAAAPPSLTRMLVAHCEGVRPPKFVARLPIEVLELRDGRITIDAETFSPTLVYLRLFASFVHLDGPVTLSVRWLHVWATPEMVRVVQALDLPNLERLSVEPIMMNGELVDETPRFATMRGFYAAPTTSSRK